MNNRYLKLLISTGVKALTGAAALAAAAAILKSDDKKEPQSSEKEAPKPDKAPQAAPEETAVPKKPSENAAYYAAKTAQAKQAVGEAALQADITKEPKPVHTENSEKPENSSPQTDWDKWEIIYRRFTERPPIKQQNIYVPDCLWEIKTVEIPKISMTEREAEAFGYSFRKKSKRIRITNYHGSEKSIIIPEYIGGLLVNEIGARAFSGSRAMRVAIPDNIKKLGEEAFAQSGVQFVIFGKGLREIPERCFCGCKDLRVAAIPPLTEKLGEKAFFGCKSLRYIEFPWELRGIGEDCFCESGLEGFAARFQGNFYPDGSAFANTPLHRRNGLVLLRKYDLSNDRDEMTVLLVGQGTDVIFTEPRVKLGRNSVCAPCDIDFTECGRFWTDGTFMYKPSYIDETENPPKICVYLPENYCGSFPCFVETYYPNGGDIGCYEKFKNDYWGRSIRIKLNADLCDRSLLLEEVDEITVESENKKLGTEAIVAPDLVKAEIYGDFQADSEIFAPVCRSLREIKLKNSNGEFSIYIPSGYVISRDIHRELLKAFCGNGSGGFFEPKVIEKVFENGVIREKSKTRMQLSRREKILLAVDVLKSSPELYPDGTEKYSRFLKRNINYARNMCGRLPREVTGYRNFVMNSRWDKP